MKRIITLAAALILTISTFAQAPEKMSYQAVIRDANNVLVSSQVVGIQISILQGSTNGPAAYIETQTPTTNANGVVSIEIGAGTVVSGDFTAIDWANSTYFLKSETDPTGGTTYTITGTSQLLSVPYALHAKTAENISGTVNYTETDPTFTDWDKSTGISITESQITDLTQIVDTDTQLDETAVDDMVANNGYLLTEVDGSITNEIELPTDANSGDMSYWNGSAWVVIAASPNEGATLQMIGGVPTWTGGTLVVDPELPAIGDYRDGGVVFWVDGNGGGLICAVSDTITDWYHDTYINTGATATSFGTGESNTSIIIFSQGIAPVEDADVYAAAYCGNGTTNGYADWYLPSRDELIEMANNQIAINATAINNGGTILGIGSYWSSSEFDSMTAITIQFSDSSTSNTDKSLLHSVRAIREF